MSYQHEQIAAVAATLNQQIRDGADPAMVLRSPELRALYTQIPGMPVEQRASFGQEINTLKSELEQKAGATEEKDDRVPIDVTAPFDVNVVYDKRPGLLPTALGSRHPLMTEMEYIIDIYARMGFTSVESRQIDDDYHMFETLNFPEGHPARDDYDTFMTTEGLIAPAHTSTMQNRVLKKYATNLANDEPIAVLIPGRVFRNEDLDATHEHTFYQFEGIYVGKDINVGNLTATLQTFLSEYFGQELKAKIQPFYFPFTEPSFEFAIEKPQSLRKDDSESEQWLELLGCGMIHPNVLKAAGIDPKEYTGFAWGCGIDRLVMMKYGIEDIRYFHSGKLDFLRQFS